MAPLPEEPSENGFQLNREKDIVTAEDTKQNVDTIASPSADEAWRYLTFKRMIFLLVAAASMVTYYFSIPILLFPLVILITFLPVLCSYIGICNFMYMLKGPGRSHSKIDKYIEFLDDSTKNKYGGRFIAIRDLYELYADGKLQFKGPVLDCLERRNEYVSYKLQWWHLKFFFKKFIPEMFHSKQQDSEQVCDHYDRGNDFYESFLGPTMVYTSGIRHTEADTLEAMQTNKIKEVCKKVLMKEGDRLLDIGCGWGTLANYAAEHFGASSTGVSLAQNQIDWANEKARISGIESKSSFNRQDYRDIAASKYDKITCLEMSEHVGIRLFPDFLNQVYELLEDDGIFFLQIAGLRRACHWEDFLWGFFMDTYIFPGADASLPLTFPVGQLEAAGFEVQSVETIGVHYSETIKRWYYNWIKPDTKEKMVNAYGIRLYRIWEIFLSWSCIIARQGNSTCYQIVAHKNLNNFRRIQFSENKSRY